MPTINPSSTNKRTSLVLLNTVLGEIGMPAITSVNSTDDTAVQLLYLANGVGEQLAMLPFWSELVETMTTTTIAGQTTYDLPIDWGVPIPGTTWDRTARWPLVGPVPSQQWQILESGIGSGTPQLRYRFINGQLVFHADPGVGRTVVVEYLSNGWALGLSGGTATTRKPRITVDTDYVLFPDRVFICGVKLAWLLAKGLNASAALAQFNQILEAGWAASNSAPILSFVPQCDDFLIDLRNVPQTGFGS